MVRGSHPVRLSLVASRLRSFVAARARSVFWRLTSPAIVAAPGTLPREGGPQQLHSPHKRHAAARRRYQPADKAKARFAPSDPSTPTTTCPYMLRPPDDEVRALGAADDASRDAAHQQATNGAMPAPADHDHIGLKAFGFAENCLNRGLVQDFSFDVGPAAREGAPCTLRRLLGSLIERAQQNRSTILRPATPRADYPDAGPIRPWKVQRGRDGGLAVAGSVCRHEDTKLSRVWPSDVLPGSQRSAPCCAFDFVGRRNGRASYLTARGIASG